MKKKIMTIMMVMLLVCMLCGCNETEKPVSGSAASSALSAVSDKPVTREVFAMDTYMSLTAYGEKAEEAVAAAIDEIKRLDALLSVGDKDSLVYKLNHGETAADSQDIAYLTEKSEWIYDNTDGAYDITIYPLMQLWGFTGDKQAVPSEEKIKETLSVCGFEKLDIQNSVPIPKKGQGIDFGGIAKGYTSGRIMDIFREYEIDCGVVSLGGNVQCYGSKPDGSLWRCGITDPDHPDDTSSLSGVVSVRDKAVITSGGYERFFEEDGKTYHHIMNPKTGYPAESGLKSVTIVSSDGTLADGLSTACFVLGKDKAVSLWENNQNLFDMILITDSGEIFITSGISDSFTSDNSYEVIE